MRRSAVTPLLAATALAVALAGCSSVADPALLAGGSAPASLGVAQSPDRALASLPAEAGAVVSVVERHGPDDVVKQTVTLAGDAARVGDNRIEITARRRDGALGRVDAETIDAEMAEALPGVAMTVSPRVVTGPNGPIGVATGSTGDVACLYAWSTAEARPRATSSTRVLGLEVSAVTSNELSVRVRLCRKGIGEERLAALAEGLRLRTDLAVTSSRAAMPVAGADALASAGYPTAVSTAPIATAPTTPRRAVEAPKPRATPRTLAAVTPSSEPKPEAPATVAAPIPLPSGG